MDDVRLGPEEVAAKEFPVTFRGFSQHEVRSFLAQVAAELAAAKERERLQRERLATAEARAADHKLTDEEVEEALGHEAGKVLQAAREAAREIRGRAEEQVARMVREATGEGSRAQHEAESLLARRSAEAEKVAAEIQAEARAQVEAELEAAKAQGREMVAEAQAVRERVLKDLARRRRAAHLQLEQLRAGRERLLDAYRVVRTTLDEATRELSVAEVEARAAAETASLRMAGQAETTVDELEAELSAARDLGLGLASPKPTESVAGRSTSGNGNGNGNGSVMAPAGRRSPFPEMPPSPPEPQVEEELGTGPEVGPVGDLPSLEVDVSGVWPDAAPSEEVLPEDAQPEEALPEEVEEAQAVGSFPEEVLPEEVEEAQAVGSFPEDAPPEEVITAEGPPEEVLVAGASSGEVPADRSAPDTRAGGVEDLFARLRAERERVESADPAHPVTAADPSPGDEEEVLQARDADLELVERSLVRALKRSLADEQNELLDNLRRHRGPLALVDLLPSASDHAARYEVVVAPDLGAAASRAAGRPGPPVEDLASAVANEVVDDLRARLERALEAAEGDEASLVEGISAAYREWKTTRAEPLARHQVAAAHTRGRFSAAPQGPLRWVVDAEEGPCPDCDDNALAGAIMKGEPFPTGQHHPPAHVGCRCTIAIEPASAPADSPAR